MKPKADKSLGQHFLKNKEVIDKICEQNLVDFDFILEVGPGPATLTQKLAERNKPFVVIEKDERFKEILEAVKPCPKILFQDALKFDLNTYEPIQNKKIWLVSNLPYNISAPLLTNFIQWPQVKAMTLMFQREVGEKTLYNEKISSLYCLVNNYFESELLLKLKPGAFHPPPEVHSVVINYKRKEIPQVSQEDFEEYENFLRKLFGQKRKQMAGSLKTYYAKDRILEYLENNNLPQTLRAEDLNLEQVTSLFHWLKK